MIWFIGFLLFYGWLIFKNFKPHIVETFHCSCIFPLLHTFFSVFPPIFSNFRPFFKFPPIFSYFLPCFHILLRMMFMRNLELYMMSWSIDFNPFISCNASTALNRVVWSLKGHVLSKECDLLQMRKYKSRRVSRKTSNHNPNENI